MRSCAVLVGAAAAAAAPSNAEWQAPSADSFRELTSDVAKRISSCEWFTGAHVANVDPKVMRDLPASCIETISPHAFTSFGAEQLRELRQLQLEKVSPSQFAALPPARCASWAEQDNFDRLDVSVCSGFSAKCVEQMREQDFVARVRPQCIALLQEPARAAWSRRAHGGPVAKGRMKASQIPDESVVDKRGSSMKMPAALLAGAAAVAGVAGYGIVRRRGAPHAAGAEGQALV